jgi:hypothetical protein
LSKNQKRESLLTQNGLEVADGFLPPVDSIYWVLALGSEIDQYRMEEKRSQVFGQSEKRRPWLVLRFRGTYQAVAIPKATVPFRWIPDEQLVLHIPHIHKKTCGSLNLEAKIECNVELVRRIDSRKLVSESIGNLSNRSITPIYLCNLERKEVISKVLEVLDLQNFKYKIERQ